MLHQFESYAVYWVPARLDGLARFGTSWMGWCAETGETRPRHVAAGLSDDIIAATRQVCRHGFHGMLKAPFRLRAGRSLWSIERALGIAAEALVVTPLPPLELVVTGGQVALVPSRPSPGLATALALVEDAMVPLEADPAPVTRRGSGSAAHADERLSQLPASAVHRFHLPFTDRLDLGTAFRIRDELAPLLAPLLAEPRHLADLALMGDPGEGRPFRVLERFDLRETPAHRSSAALPCLGPQTLVQMPLHPLANTDVAV